MNIKDISHLELRRNDLLEELQAIGPVMRGSVTEIGPKNNKQPHFSVSIEGRTKLIYLGKKRELQAREYSQNYKRLMEITQEMTLLNMELLKLQGQRDKSGGKKSLEQGEKPN